MTINFNCNLESTFAPINKLMEDGTMFVVLDENENKDEPRYFVIESIFCSESNRYNTVIKLRESGGF